MNQMLSKSAQNIQQALTSQGLEYTVFELSESTRTANDAASAIGCDVSQIVKSLIFKTKSTHQPILILVSGPNRVNEKVIESFVHEKITKADAHFTKEITGFAIGGIPPIGHRQPIDHVFIDEDLLKFDSVWAAAGTPNAVFNLSGKDLQRITNGKVLSIL